MLNVPIALTGVLLSKHSLPTAVMQTAPLVLTLSSPAALLVRADSAVPAVRGGEQGGGSCPPPAHPAGAAPGLSSSSSSSLWRPLRANAGWGEWNAKGSDFKAPAPPLPLTPEYLTL